MKIKNYRLFYNSISFKIVLIISIILAPLITLLIYNNYKSRESLLEQVEGTHRNMLQSYMTQIDAQLKNSMWFALDMALFQDEPKVLLSETDDSNIAYTQFNIYTKLSNRLLSNNLIDVFFLYVKSGNYFIAASQNGISDHEISAIKKYMLSNLESLITESAGPKSSWTFTSIGGKNALINLSYRTSDIIAGVYTSTDRYLKDYNKGFFLNSKLEFISTDTISSEISKLHDETLPIIIKSTVANISLAEYVPKSEILKSLPFIQKNILLASIVFILMMPILLFLMKLIVVNPLHELTKAMAMVRIGDLNHRIKNSRCSNEFELVNGTFNNMMNTVQNLKINVYEEKIKVQKSQLRNLQLQIKPHFLINSLNMVNNLIYNGDLETAKELILHSVDYFRYMSKADNDFVLLNEEVKHITNYLEIQKIRYAEKFSYSININRLIEDMLIPPMLIQNFVENSVKYAIQMTTTIHISVKIEYFEVDYYPYAKIIVSDTGVGYPDNVLHRLNSGKKITDSLGEHIGIYNSVQRIKILFDSKAGWKFYNDGGAVSEITLPALFSD